MADLYVIEAPGKTGAWSSALKDLGVAPSPAIVATGGHLFGYPKKLFPVGISLDDRSEPLRTLRDDSPGLNRLMGLLNKGVDGRLVLCLDDDPEGHVIADDIVRLSGGRIPPEAITRVRSSGCDAEALDQAIRQASPPDPVLAWPGTARRIVDRLLAATFSDPERGLYAGRVRVALLEHIRSAPVPTGILTLTCPAGDGGPPFRARMTVTTETARYVEELQRASTQLRPLPVSGNAREAVCRPLSFPDIVMLLSVRGRLPLYRIAPVTQFLYESGKMTYPRSSGHGFTVSGARLLHGICRKAGVPDGASFRYPLIGDEPHESPRPGAFLDLNRSPQNPEDASLVYLSRYQAASGLILDFERPDPGRLPGVFARLAWRRPAAGNGGIPGWLREILEPEPGYVRYTPEQQVLAALSTLKIGTPGTLIRHCGAVFQLGYLSTEDASVTPRGMRLLSSVPEPMLDRILGREIEGLLMSRNRHDPPWTRVLMALDMLEQRERVQATLENDMAQSGRASPGPVRAG